MQPHVNIWHTCRIQSKRGVGSTGPVQTLCSGRHNDRSVHISIRIAPRAPRGHVSNALPSPKDKHSGQIRSHLLAIQGFIKQIQNDCYSLAVGAGRVTGIHLADMVRGISLKLPPKPTSNMTWILGIASQHHVILDVATAPQPIPRPRFDFAFLNARDGDDLYVPQYMHAHAHCVYNQWQCSAWRSRVLCDHHTKVLPTLGNPCQFPGRLQVPILGRYP